MLLIVIDAPWDYVGMPRTSAPFATHMSPVKHHISIKNKKIGTRKR
jgi:hypothetical protein